ncbi:hypothetical protein GCM10017744_101140 [Streptomyces antimycoticus]
MSAALVSVAGVIVDDAGRALLIKRRDNGKWEPPAVCSNGRKPSPTRFSAKSSKRPVSRSRFPRPHRVYKNMTA